MQLKVELPHLNLVLVIFLILQPTFPRSVNQERCQWKEPCTKTQFQKDFVRSLLSIPNIDLRSVKFSSGDRLIEIDGSFSTLNTNFPNDFIDFKIGYGIEANRVEAFLSEVWKNACETAAIDKEQSLHIALKDCGDHAATWRLSYTMKSPHQVILCQNAVREAAYDLQDKHGIEVSTPLTHKVQGDSQGEKLED